MPEEQHEPKVVPEQSGGSNLAGPIVRTILGLTLLGFILTRIDISELAVLASPPALLSLAGAFLLLVAAQVFSAVRWKAVLAGEDLGVRYLFRLFLIGQFFSLFLPTSIGGDAVRAIAVARARGRAGEAVTSVAFDRAAGVTALLGYLVIGAAALPAAASRFTRSVTFSLPLWSVLAAVALGAAVAGLFYLFRHRFPRVTALLAQGFELAAGLLQDLPRLAWILTLSFVVQGIYIAVWYVIGLGLGLDVSWLFFVFAVPVVSLVAMLPISISGVGLREGAWVLLLAPFGVSAALGVALGLGYLIAFTAMAAVGGVWFSLSGTAPTDTGADLQAADPDQHREP